MVLASVRIYSLHTYIQLTPRRVKSKDDIRPQLQQDFNLTTDATGVFNSTLTRDIAVPINAIIDELDNIPLSEVQGFKEPALPWYSDQILPFDITVAAANEYGAAASSKLYGVEILNEGFGSSVDDSVLEMQATFVARSVLMFDWGMFDQGLRKYLVFGPCRAGCHDLNPLPDFSPAQR